MIPALFDQSGNRKYLICERKVGVCLRSIKGNPDISTFCLTLAFAGARISEVLSLTVTRIDTADEAIVFETFSRGEKVFSERCLFHVV